MESSNSLSNSSSSGGSRLDTLFQKIQLFAENYARVTDRSSKLFSKRIELLTAINDTATNCIKTAAVSEEEFTLFLTRIHDYFFDKYIDTTFKTILLRCIRLCVRNNNDENPSFLQILMSKDYHIILISSLEAESAQISEKAQAVRIIAEYIRLSPSSFPLSLTRSLLAIAAEENDPLQRMCIEQLRLLVLVNSSVLAQTECMSLFVDTILDYRQQDLADPIIFTVLHLCSNNKAKSAVNIKTFIRRIISVFTDVYIGDRVDFGSAGNGDLDRQLGAAKNCLVTIMRSYFGVVALTSDKCGLHTLVSLLTDQSIPHGIIDKVLDVINSVIEPFFSSIAVDSLNVLHRQRYDGVNGVAGSLDSPEGLGTGGSLSELTASVPSREHAIITNAVSPPTSPIPIDTKSSLKSTPVQLKAGGATAGAVGGGGFLGLLSRATNPFLSPANVKAKPADPKKAGFGSTKDSSNNNSNNSNNNNNSSSSHGGAGVQGGSLLQRKLSSLGVGLGLVDRESSSASASQPVKVNTDLTSQLIKADNEKADRSTSHSNLFNATDSFSSLICCALVSVNIVENLCVLSSSSDNDYIADKSEKLLVDIIVLIQKCLSHYRAFEILNSNVLLDYVNNASTRKISAANRDRGRCTMVLLDLASTFSKAANAKPSSKGNADANNNSSLNAKAGQSDLAGGFSEMSGIFESNIRRSFNSTQKTAMPGISATSSSSNSSRGRVVNIGDLTVEMTSKALSPLPSTTSEGRSTSALQLKYFEEAKRLTKSFIEKVDFSNHVEMTRLISREGKEPMKWDWRLITDILEGALKFGDKTLDNCFQSKWIRRLNSFYGFSFGEDKNVDINFCMLPWDPLNFTYADCLSYLCDLFVKTNSSDMSRGVGGVNNLLNDFQSSGKFKFVILNDMLSELESLVSKDNQRLWSSIINGSNNRGIEVFSNTNSTLGSSGNISGVSSSSSGNNLTASRSYIFGIDNCNTSLTRDYFTILGRVSRSKVGKAYLNSSGIFTHISKLSMNPQYDYLCRLLLLNLVVNDNGYFSKYLVSSWYKDCSKELKEYMCNLLKVEFQRQPSAGNYWIVAFFTDMLDQDPALLSSIVDMIEESPIRKQCLRAVTLKASALLASLYLRGGGAARPIVNFLAISEGVNLFNPLLQSRLATYFESDYKLYCAEVQNTFRRLLHGRISIGGGSGATSERSHVDPIDLSSRSPHVTKYRSHMNTSLDGGNRADAQTHSNDILHSNVSIEGLLSLPFNIVVNVSNSNASASSKSLTFGQKLVDSIKIDTFVDPKDDSPSSSYVSDISRSHFTRVVRVRGVVVDDLGVPSAFAINKSHIIASSLQIGACPFLKNGSVISISTDANSSRDGTAGAAAATPSGAQKRTSVTLGSRRPGSLDMSSANMGNSLQTLDNVLGAGGGGGNTSYANGGYSSNANGKSNISRPYQARAPSDPREWTLCASDDRSSSSDLGSGTFSVELRSEPVVLIFSRSKPSVRVGGMSRTTASSTTEDPSLVYLVEVQYLLLIDRAFGSPSSVPRHICGELARSSEGCILLSEIGAAKLMLSVALSEPADPEARKAALWSLGHMCTTDAGLDIVLAAEPAFVECLSTIVFTADNYNLRATAFYAMGLVSQSQKGCTALQVIGWSAISKSIAIPINPRMLFDPSSNKKLLAGREREKSLDTLYTLADASSLTPFLNAAGNTDLLVLNLISKLPGSIPAIYKDAKSRLEQLRLESPGIFEDNQLFRKAALLLECYSFKLGVRRYVMRLFGPGAKCSQQA